MTAKLQVKVLFTTKYVELNSYDKNPQEHITKKKNILTNIKNRLKY